MGFWSFFCSKAQSHRALSLRRVLRERANFESWSTKVNIWYDSGIRTIQSARARRFRSERSRPTELKLMILNANPISSPWILTTIHKCIVCLYSISIVVIKCRNSDVAHKSNPEWLFIIQRCTNLPAEEKRLAPAEVPCDLLLEYNVFF